MFKKEKDIEQRTSNVIKNKDFKKLKSDLLKQFLPLSSSPNSGIGITEDSLAVLFPHKCSVSCTKLTSRTLIYSVDMVPMFFDVNGRCDFYPTVFALWKVPALLPQIVIHSPVSTFVLRGADLMAPGISKLDAIHKGEKVSIRVNNNSSPFAVGISEVDSAVDFSASSTSPKGKAAQVLHMFGDALWKNVPMEIPNKGFALLTVVTGDGHGSSSDDEEYDNEEVINDQGNDENGNEKKHTGEGDDDVLDLENLSLGVSLADHITAPPVTETGYNDEQDENKIENKIENSNITPVATAAEVDELLLLHLLRCLKYIIKDHDLPVLVSTLWATVKKSIGVLAINSLSKGTGSSVSFTATPSEIDIRHSSFSKVSNFFQFVSESIGLLNVTEVSSGVDAVDIVVRQHDLYKTWKHAILVDDPDKFRAAMSQTSDSNSNSNNSASEKFSSNSYCAPLSGLRTLDVLPNIEVGSSVKVIDIYKLTKDLRTEFKSIDDDIAGKGVEKYCTGAEVQQLLTQYIKALQLENPAAKGQLIIPSTNFFYKTLQKEQIKFDSKSSKTKPASEQGIFKIETVSSPLPNNPSVPHENVAGESDDEWDKDPYEDEDEVICMKSRSGVDWKNTNADIDPLAPYTVVAGVIMHSSLSNTPKIHFNPSVPPPSTSLTEPQYDNGSSRRSNIPGGWGVAKGGKWKPIELPAPSPANSSKKSDLKQQLKQTYSGGKLNQNTQQQMRQSTELKQQQRQSDAAAAIPLPPLPVSKELFMKILKTKFTPYHAIAFPSGECTIAAGNPSQILVEVEMRKGNKVVTKVSGLETYRFDITQTARDFQKKFACSTTVAPCAKKMNQNEIVLQGNWSDELIKYLVDNYAMQKRFIECKISGKIKPKKK